MHSIGLLPASLCHDALAASGAAPAAHLMSTPPLLAQLEAAARKVAGLGSQV
jgi:hypothetical protein